MFCRIDEQRPRPTNPYYSFCAFQTFESESNNAISKAVRKAIVEYRARMIEKYKAQGELTSAKLEEIYRMKEVKGKDLEEFPEIRLSLFKRMKEKAFFQIYFSRDFIPDAKLESLLRIKKALYKKAKPLADKLQGGKKMIRAIAMLEAEEMWQRIEADKRFKDAHEKSAAKFFQTFLADAVVRERSKKSPLDILPYQVATRTFCRYNHFPCAALKTLGKAKRKQLADFRSLFSSTYKIVIKKFKVQSKQENLENALRSNERMRESFIQNLLQIFNDRNKFLEIYKTSRIEALSEAKDKLYNRLLQNLLFLIYMPSDFSLFRFIVDSRASVNAKRIDKNRIYKDYKKESMKGWIKHYLKERAQQKKTLRHDRAKRLRSIEMIKDILEKFKESDRISKKTQIKVYHLDSKTDHCLQATDIITHFLGNYFLSKENIKQDPLYMEKLEEGYEVLKERLVKVRLKKGKKLCLLEPHKEVKELPKGPSSTDS